MRGDVTGRLVSRQFLQDMWREFAGRLGEDQAAAAARRLARWGRAVEASLGPASGVTAIHDLAVRALFKVLGFEVVRGGASRDALVSVASGRRTGSLPLVVGVWTDRLDSLTRRAVHEAVARGARWAFCSNGRMLRLVDADRPYARRHLDFDLSPGAPHDEACRVLWAMARAAAFERRPGSGETLIGALVGAADTQAGRVAGTLQQGVRAALETLVTTLANGRPEQAAAIVDESLTIVYRLLFLLFAEARSLVPMWNPIYRASYSIGGLRGAGDASDSTGLWEAVLAISRLAHAGCASRDLRVTAFNSQLFAPERTPLVERAHVDDETMRQVLRALTDGRPRSARATPTPPGAARIVYADLGVEQLGTIYERLLDVTPDLEIALARTIETSRRAVPRPRAAPLRDRADPPARRTTQPSARRKESGTFYTPRSMAEFLVRETLGPLVRDRRAEDILRLRVLDPAMGSGAFLVAACRFLAEAMVEAHLRDGDGPADVASHAGRVRLRRLVAQRCLYGVDVNPVAVQLARLSLWLATLAADAPLTFLDHHLCAGDSLVGASIDDVLRGWPGERRTRSRREPHDGSLFDVEALSGVMRETLPLRAQLAGPDDTPARVRDKERALARSLGEGALARWMTVADLWCARWFWPDAATAPSAAAWRALADTVVHGASALPAHVARPTLETASAIARTRRFLHWGLRFPEVFFADAGEARADAGFDAVVGNPPWDMVRGDTREADASDAGRGLAAALGRFVRDTRRYRNGHTAHINRYQLFTERALSLLRPGGRLGLVTPWGLASDVASAPLRRQLFEACDTETLLGFDNGDAIFPIHRSVRFLLLVATTGRPTERIACRFGERTLDVLEGRPTQTPAVTVTPQWLKRVSGDGMEAPWVQRERDVALVDRLHARWPAMASPDGWAARFSRELNATDDRGWFVDGASGIPVVDGRHLTPFSVHVDRSTRAIPASLVPALRRRLPGVTRARLAYRDIASPTNRVTLIAALLPPHVVTTHTLFCLESGLDLHAQRVLCALMNSLVANYLVRLRVTTHVTTALVARLPMPRPAWGGEVFERLAAGAHALEQAATSAETADAARFERSPDWATLQACAAHAYGLTRRELDHVISTFPLLDRSALGAVSDAFDASAERE